MTPILLALLFIAILILVVIAGRPDEFCITRTTSVAASPATVFLHVNDLHAWEAWSPWAKLDPQVKNTFDGAASGKGAVMAWSGNKKVGAGRMTITESRASDLIRIQLEFIRPFKATNTVEFTFRVEDGQTTVSWSMMGKNNLGAKIFTLFMNCENMIGKDFEKGLASLKAVVEKQ